LLYLTPASPGGKAVAVNSFRTKKFEDFEILDSDRSTLGHVRVKPSGILWAKKDAKVWHGVSLSKFAEFAETEGKRQKK
jgi:hypothetical protein